MYPETIMDLPNRHSIRLKNYDYSSNGAYFITICTQDRLEIFGSVGVDLCVDPKQTGQTPRSAPTICMKLNATGKMVNNWWLKIPNKFPDIELATFQIMPNHVHGIIIINGNGQTHRSAPTIGTIIQWFKTMTTNEYIKNVKQLNWPMFNKRVWQRNYWEHVIRNEKDFDQISQYIINNPLMWDRDKNNPNATKDLTPF